MRSASSIDADTSGPTLEAYVTGRQMPIKDILVGLLETELGVDTSDVEGDTPLFSSGLIDSFSLVSLLTCIESKWGFKVAPMEVNLDNMDSLERMTTYVSSKTGGGLDA